MSQPHDFHLHNDGPKWPSPSTFCDLRIFPLKWLQTINSVLCLISNAERLGGKFQEFGVGAPPVRNETCYLRKKKFSPSGSVAISHPLQDRDELPGPQACIGSQAWDAKSGPLFGVAVYSPLCWAPGWLSGSCCICWWRTPGVKSRNWALSADSPSLPPASSNALWPALPLNSEAHPHRQSRGLTWASSPSCPHLLSSPPQASSPSHSLPSLPPLLSPQAAFQLLSSRFTAWPLQVLPTHQLFFLFCFLSQSLNFSLHGLFLFLAPFQVFPFLLQQPFYLLKFFFQLVFGVC